MNESLDPLEVAVSVQAADIDRLGHVNNTTYLRWVQESAGAHWRKFAPAADQARLAWVVLRHEIDYKRAAYLQDGIIAKTWVGTAEGIRFERFTEPLRAGDRVLLAKARTIWCPIDLKTGMPTTVGPHIYASFSRPAGTERG